MTIPASARSYFDCVYHKPWTLVNIRQLFTMALQTHWMHPEHHQSTIGTTDLACLRYAPDSDKEIILSERLTIAPTHTIDETRPTQGVYIGVPGGIQFKKLVTDNLAGTSIDTSEEIFAHQATVGLLFSHLHSNADTALLMMQSTSVFLYALRKHLKQHPNFLGMDPGQASDARLIEKASEPMYRVDLSYSFSFNYQASVSLESHRLKTYGAQLSESA